MGETVYARLTEGELPAFRAFCREAWGKEHPLIHNEGLFDYYYRREGAINFVCAKSAETGELLSVCGYIPASRSDRPDVWLSFLVSSKNAPLGLSLGLISSIRDLTGCRTLACNNIRPKTAALYQFFGYTVATLTQYYRISNSVKDYTLCRIISPQILSFAPSRATFEPLPTAAALETFDFKAYENNKPYKDRDYVARRYFDNGYLPYRVFLGREDGQAFCLLCLRVIEQPQGRVVRVVDYVGDRAKIPACGVFLDRFLRDTGAEFCDWYAYGIPDEVMARAGFAKRAADDVNILPNYLEPPLMENVDFTLFTSEPEDYAMFKADGDQDRANLG